MQEGGTNRRQVLCGGLIDDWTRWQDSGDARFDLLCRLLGGLNPDDQPLQPGQPFRPTLDDSRRIPTIQMPYGQDVPITYAPAGVRRMCKLAYLLAWTFSEHEAEVEQIGQPPSRQIVVLIDEPETHLHPRWQRTVLPSLANAVRGWHTLHEPLVQFLVATHSPLVLASMEPEFDEAKDALWKLDMVAGDVRLDRDPWHRRGDVNRWLVSDVFDLGAPTSREAERVLADASGLLAADHPAPDEVRRSDEALGRLLPQMDPFFVRWRYYMDKHLEADSR